MKREFLENLIQARRNSDPLNLESVKAHGENWNDLDLSGADLKKAVLTATHLQNCNLSGANLTFADLTFANLSQANLSYAVLQHADLREANLTNANLNGTDLSHIKHSNQPEIIAILGGANTKKLIRTEEAHSRATIDLLSSQTNSPTLPPLPVLPSRWETLNIEAKKRNIPLKPLIHPVKEAIEEIKRELDWIEHTKTGKLFVFSGISGSGKTTFINSLDLFVTVQM